MKTGQREQNLPLQRQQECVAARVVRFERMKMPHVLRYCFLLVAALLIQGCASMPPADTSSLAKPSPGTAGVYFFQWKTGFIGSLFDVDFVLDGDVRASINTGEWTYLEVPAGKHTYRMMSGLLRTEVEQEFLEGQNYFFQGALSMGSGQVGLVQHPRVIEQTMQFIKDGTYKKRPAR